MCAFRPISRRTEAEGYRKRWIPPAALRKLASCVILGSLAFQAVAVWRMVEYLIVTQNNPAHESNHPWPGSLFQIPTLILMIACIPFVSIRAPQPKKKHVPNPALSIRPPMKKAWQLTLILALAYVHARPQIATPPPPQPEFEAASIRMVDPHTADDLSRGIGLISESSFPTNLFTIRNAPLAFLVQLAYATDSQEHISAMPGWMESQEYDVSAKVEGDQQLTLEQMRPMLQRLLKQRFHFAAHHETRVIAGFALVVAKGGPKLQPSDGEGKPFAQMRPDRMDVRHMDAGHIAGILAHRAGQPVVDKTGLTGIYDFKLSYAPASGDNSNLPDFFTALQEQLGLKLQSQKIPVDYLVIDHVDKIPTEN